MSQKRNVVVIGGGVAGPAVAKALAASLDPAKHTLTLISSRTRHIHYIASLRMLVSDDGKLEDHILVRYDRLFKDAKLGTFKQGFVTAINVSSTGAGGSVALESGEEVPYDALVVATGSKWESLLDFPHDDAAMVQHVQEWRKKFAEANEVVIAGAGAVGIELAGELQYYYPSKPVRLVHSSDLPLNAAYSTKFRKAVLKRILASPKIKVHLSDTVPLDAPEGTLPKETNNGVALPASYLLVATRGGKPNTQFLEPALVTSKGRVKVRDTLQLQDHPDIFAAGDIIDWAEQAQAMKATAHSDVVAKNVKAVLEGRAPVAVYKTAGEGVVLTYGKKGGKGYLPFFGGVTIGDWTTSLLKGSLFVSMAKKALNYA